MSSIHELERLARATLSTDAATALAACHRVEHDELPWLRERAVVLARRDGWAWRPIAKLLGVSHQALIKRYRASEHQLVQSVRPRPEWGVEQERLVTQQLRDLRLQNELTRWERSGIDIVPW